MVLLAVVFGLTFFRMSVQIEESIEKNLAAVRNRDFLLPSLMQTYGLDSNSLVLFVNLPDKTIGHISGDAHFSEDNLNYIIDEIVERPKMNGKLKVGNKYLAYNKQQVFDSARIIIYDYTLQQNSLRALLIILAGVYAAALISLYFIFRVSADKAVRPIENAFIKQRELIANASHELKTPLTIIDTSLSIINANKNESVDFHNKWFENISLQSSRMSALISEMLELAKADNLNASFIKTIVNVSDILQGVLLEMEAAFYENGIKLDTAIAENIMVKGDGESIKKLFYIFAENAVKYTPANGNISVKLYYEKRKAVFSIRNSGGGIPREKIPKLFDRFYRTDEARTQGTSHSFGLGLAIAKSILDSMDAYIEIDSKENEYTEFVILFKRPNPLRNPIKNKDAQ